VYDAYVNVLVDLRAGISGRAGFWVGVYRAGKRYWMATCMYVRFAMMLTTTEFVLSGHDMLLFSREAQTAHRVTSLCKQTRV
jgi:hypothetical protein